MSLIFEVINIDDIKKIIKDGVIIKNKDHSIHYLGIGYVKSLSDWIDDNYPDINYRFICDCDNNPALVVGAINMGFKYILFKGDSNYHNKLQNIADKSKVTLLYV